MGKGRFIIDCYNNEEHGWFHVLPIDNKEAVPLMSQYEIAKHKHSDIFHNIFPYNNSWWAVIEAENVLDAIVIFSDIYRNEVYKKAFNKFLTIEKEEE